MALISDSLMNWDKSPSTKAARKTCFMCSISGAVCGVRTSPATVKSVRAKKVPVMSRLINSGTTVSQLDRWPSSKVRTRDFPGALRSPRATASRSRAEMVRQPASRMASRCSRNMAGVCPFTSDTLW
jgi:hypothetical protein